SIAERGRRSKPISVQNSLQPGIAANRGLGCENQRTLSSNRVCGSRIEAGELPVLLTHQSLILVPQPDIQRQLVQNLVVVLNEGRIVTLEEMIGDRTQAQAG